MNFLEKILLELAVPLAKDILPKLATKATSCVFGQFKKITGHEAV